MISVKNITKEFSSAGKTFKACDNISFEVKSGEIFGIIGLSGAGKSTLLRCLNLLEKPTSGEIYIDGQNICTLRTAELLRLRKKVSMIFQSFNLFKQKSVFENIAYPLRISRKDILIDGKKITNAAFEQYVREKAERLASFVGLHAKLYAYPNELSGGEKQRVAIARALASEPEILLCDEATSALDPANTKQIVGLIKKAVAEFNMSCVLITHQMEVAKTLCDRIAVMESGKIIEENTVEGLFQNPKTALAKSFIGKLQSEPLEELFSIENFSKAQGTFVGELVRLTYSAKTVNEPVLNDCIKQYPVSINFLAGNINNLKTGQVGFMIVSISGERNEIERALQFLEQHGVGVEIINFNDAHTQNKKNNEGGKK